jgi:hypothetical protein
MLTRLCALWLIVLVLLPFTAPFSTFDLTDLFPGPSDGIAAAPRSALPTTAIARAAFSHAVPFPPRMSRLRVAVTRLRLSNVTASMQRSERRPLDTATIHALRSSSRSAVLRI